MTNEYITHRSKSGFHLDSQRFHTFTSICYSEELVQAFGMISEQPLPHACEVDVTGDDQILLGAHDMDV